tara:strand:- start:74819 stop:75427 length:609 start_codon:yes stop_codon:yes gene_type:complete
MVIINKLKITNMNTNTHNLYLFKAMEAYPWDLEKAVEALQYALSYEPENVTALCLMAKVHAEQLCDYETAKGYFEKAVASDISAIIIYPDYVRTLLQNHDFKEAQKLIDFAMTVKAVDKGGLFLLQGQLLESLQKFEEAEAAFKEARQLGLNSDFIEFVESELERVTKKRERQNREQKTEKPKEKYKAEDSKGWMHRLNSLL